MLINRFYTSFNGLINRPKFKPAREVGMNFHHFGQQSGFLDWRWYVSTIKFFLLISIPFYLLAAVLVSPLIFFLWNSLMPVLFGFKRISELQAVGLFLLARLLFSSK